MSTFAKIGSQVIDICMKFMSRTYYFALGYPRFQYEEHYLRRLGVPETEIEASQRYGPHMSTSHAIVIVLFLAISIKEMQYPIYMIHVLHDFNEHYPTNLAQNFKQADAVDLIANQTHKFACLETDCPFVETLITLPIFYLCRPGMRMLNGPLVHMHYIGIVGQTVMSYMYLVFGVLLPLYYYFLPTSHIFSSFCLMFSTTKRSLHEFVRKQIMYINISTINYYECLRELSLSQNANDTTFEEPYIELNLVGEAKQLKVIDKPFKLLGKEARNYIADCLTVYRSKWWHKSTEEHFVLVFMILFWNNMFLGTAALIYLLYLKGKCQIEFELINQRMRQYSCSLWNAKSGTLVEDIDLNLSLYSMVEISFGFVFLQYVGAYNLSLMVQAIQELKFQIIEQMDRIRLTIEMTEILKTFSGESLKSKGFDIELQSAYAPFKQVRDMHRKSFEGFYLLKYLNPFRTNTLIQSKATYEDNLQVIVIEQLLEKRDIDFDAYLSSLIKLHVGLRLLAKLVKDSSLDTTAVLAFCSIISLGIVLILFYYKTQLTTLSGNLALCVIGALVLYNILILIPSSIHATSKHLLILMWRLIAAQTHFKDARLRHLRLLLIKQTALLCDENGLSLKAFNTSPVTYAFIIKIIIWTSSLLLLSTGRQV